MIISGLRKLTLLDFPGHVACTIFTAGCNLRCPFCHNASLVLPEREFPSIDTQEVLAFLNKRKNVLNGVAITGGEPLLQAGMKDLILRIRELGYPVKLDTNGTFPDKLEELLCDGLVDYVAMDIKNAPSLYPETAGCDASLVSAVERSRNLLLKGTVPYEFRTTVVKGLHSADSLRTASEWIRGASHYYLQQFISSGDLINETGLSSFTSEEMQSLLTVVREAVPAAELRGVDI